MIFSGDIACPDLESFPKIIMPDDLKKKPWVCNLEGSIVIDKKHFIKKEKVFNSFPVIKKLKTIINIKAFALANNHISDTSSIASTKKFLNSLNIRSFGAGENSFQASVPYKIIENNQEFTVLNFGWKNINCIESGPNKEGVNSYYKLNVINQVNEILLSNKYAKIIIFFHWNYELEVYPQPFDREFSKILIDIGVEAIIGAHAHRVQGAEIYKKKPIIYGLGNFIFSQNVFWNKKLKFPEFCSLQLCFEIDLKINKYFCHWFNYDKENNVLKFIKSEELKNSETLKKLSPYINMPENKYKKWFKLNRFQKKLLPIFYLEDSQSKIKLKNNWIFLRQHLVMFLFRLKNILRN
jgi:hypothetical protein